MNMLYLDREIISKFPLELIEKYKLIPIEIRDQTLIVLAEEDEEIYHDILGHYFEYDLEIIQTSQTLLDKKIKELKNLDLNSNIFKDLPGVKDNEIVFFLNSILNQAIVKGASDIHIEAYEKTKRIRFRINGRLKFISSLDDLYYQGLLTRIKLLADLNIADRRNPQDGRIILDLEGQSIDMRVAILPTIFGEKIVLRILDKNKPIFKINNLGLGLDQAQELKSLYRQAYGVLLITGPAGSGKTTSLYSILQELNDTSKNILTIEDPIEYTIEGINQTQIDEKINYTFHKSFKSILRQDPNIIMIGELREKEVARLALESGITGHLILSTIHTNNTSSTITRLRSMEIPNYLIGEGLIGIVSQRLVGLLCNRCKLKRRISSQEKLYLGLDEDIDLYEPGSCDYCNGGYDQVQLVAEILKLDSTLKQLISSNASMEQLEAYIRSRGFKSLRSRVLDLVLEGKTSLDEFYKVELVL